ncbi:MAG: DUF3747 domain-containing protein [Cyanobacteriota bacterium]
MKRFDPRPALLSAATVLTAGLPLGMGAPASAQKALFLAREVPQERFILVAAPIGSGERAQLNIYEQLNDRRLCFSTSGAAPAIVNPLLGTFDFTGICNRFIDANGYSLRIGEDDLATRYRLSVVRGKGDTVLLAVPLKPEYGTELVVARTNGTAPGFLQLVFEPGWMLKRRHFGPRPLGHVYIYRDGAADTAASPQPATPAAGVTAPTGAVKAPAPAPAPAARVPVPATPAAALTAPPVVSPVSSRPARGSAPAAAPATLPAASGAQAVSPVSRTPR